MQATQQGPLHGVPIRTLESLDKSELITMYRNSVAETAEKVQQIQWLGQELDTARVVYERSLRDMRGTQACAEQHIRNTRTQVVKNKIWTIVAVVTSVANFGLMLWRMEIPQKLYRAVSRIFGGR